MNNDIYKNWMKVSLTDFRNNIYQFSEKLEQEGVGLLVMKRGHPYLLVQPISYIAYKNMLEKLEGLLNTIQDDNEVYAINMMIQQVKVMIYQYEENAEKTLQSNIEMMGMYKQMMPVLSDFIEKNMQENLPNAK